MNQTSGIGSSREDSPPAELVFSASSSASRPAGVVQETVLNPEGRRLGAEGGTSLTFEVAPSAADSRVWKRLFPGEADPTGADFDTPAACELGHFAIEERIGAGGMGAVFRALDTRLQRVVALKVLSPAQSRDRASVLRFQNEARAAARLDHENIARVHYIGEDRGLHFIAFEYVTGQNVRDLITRTGRLAVADAVNYALQIASALRHTASAGVVHRDIKPSNIIITPSGRAKLVDLGLARKLASDSVGDLTIAGTTLGTFDYISPEQARDPRTVDVRSDIYSLGCTLYHMLTGGPPYSSGTVLQKLLDHQSGHAPDPRAVNGQVPPALAAVCRKMMAGDPKNRYSTPDELIRDLAAVAAPLGLRPMPADGYVWARPAAAASPVMRSGLIWAASLAVVVLLAIAVDRWPIGIDPDRSNEPRNADGAQAISSPRDRLEESAGHLPPQVEPPIRQGGRLEETAGSADGPNVSPGSDDQSKATLAGGASTRPGGTGRQGASAVRDSASGVQAEAPDTDRLASGADQGPGTAQSKSAEELFQLLNRARELGAALWPDASPVRPSEGAQQPPSSVAERSERPPFGTEAEIVLLSPSGEPNVYDSLADAVTAALPGDTIELHYDGLPVEPSGPLSVRDKQVTIRAGGRPGGEVYRPVIEFVGDADRDPYAASRMVTVAGEGGSLHLSGVEVRFSVRGEARNAAGRWALFALSDVEQVRLTGTAVTLVNPEAWPLTVFDLRPPEGVSAEGLQIMGMMNSEGAEGFSIEMQRCLVRGEADLVTVAHTLPGQVSATDSAFALGSALLNVTGGTDLPLAGDLIDVELDHVTSVVGQAVVQVELGSGREATPLRVAARDSLFSTTSPGPLVLMDGDKTESAFEKLLTWNGRRNVFDGFSRFWTIFDEDGAAVAGSPNFASWLSRWRSAGPAAGSSDERAIAPGSADNVWVDPEAARYKTRSEVTADDLELDVAAVPVDTLDASDGGLVGAAPERLPKAYAAPARLGAAGAVSPR